jgi:putative transposase
MWPRPSVIVVVSGQYRHERREIIGRISISSGHIPRRLRRRLLRMSEYIHKSHNVTVLLYHVVLTAKYRRSVFDDRVDDVLKEVCLEISERYQVKLLEIGTDKDRVNFLVQSVPTYSVTKIVTMLKSLTAREIFKRCPHVRKMLWGGEFWTDGDFASTVGTHGDEQMIGRYVKNQAKEYNKLHSDHQLALF